MIAAAMSTAIIAAGIGALTVSQKTTQASSQVGNTQATARNALDMIAADIKLAGFGMQGLVGVPPLPAAATLGAVGNCQINGAPAAIVPGDNNALGADFGPDSISLVVPMTNSITAAGALWQVATAGGPAVIGGATVSIAAIPLPANATTAMGNAVPGGAAALVGLLMVPLVRELPARLLCRLTSILRYQDRLSSATARKCIWCSASHTKLFRRRMPSISVRAMRLA
jgi:type IV pilus assembly protein PilW